MWTEVGKQARRHSNGLGAGREEKRGVRLSGLGCGTEKARRHSNGLGAGREEKRGVRLSGLGCGAEKARRSFTRLRLRGGKSAVFV